jgi:AcrR family transcriptional regulator
VADSGDWRRRRWEATHQRIYDVALALFEEHGFEQVSVGQIASGADISVPTFYAHYPSKEQVLIQLTEADSVAPLLAEQPADLPVGERFRRTVRLWLADVPEELLADVLARWRIIAATPSLRLRVAEFERTSGRLLAEGLPAEDGSRLASDSIVINAYMSAYTAGVLAWADGNGERSLGELLEEAFDMLDQQR